jgi:lipopolysaccharide biosynthesis glycosyltransferase
MDLDICYAINDKYVDYCIVSMVSVMENNPQRITFHILTDNLEKSNYEKLQNTVSRYGNNLKIYHMDDSRLEGQNTSWSKYGWYRIFAPEVLDERITRLLYLDCDTIVCGDISSLFKIKKDEWSVGAVPDIMDIFPAIYEFVGYEKQKGYFCSGVLMLNLSYFRENNIAEKILRFAIENPDRINFPDQDALNYVCQDSKVTLHLKYGILEPFFRNQKFINIYRDEVKEALEDPRIIHYAGCAPWIKESNPHYFDYLFWKYADMIGGITKRHNMFGLDLIKYKVKQTLAYCGYKPYASLKKRRRLTEKEIYLNLKKQ